MTDLSLDVPLPRKVAGVLSAAAAEYRLAAARERRAGSPVKASATWVSVADKIEAVATEIARITGGK